MRERVRVRVKNPPQTFKSNFHKMRFQTAESPFCKTSKNREGRKSEPISKTGSQCPPQILAVLDRLNEAYHYDEFPADQYATGEPLDGLLLTLLSQNTNDRNRDMAYEKLRSVCPSWREVAALSPPEISALIKSAGLGDTKALRMKDILLKIHDDFGDYTD